MPDTVYWSNYSDNTIRRAPLAGGGTPDILYDSTQGVSGPMGLALDPAAGRIYWSNYGDDKIQGAPLAGGNAQPLYDSADGVSDPVGLAIDPAAGRIYWSNQSDHTIRRAPLAGGASTPDTLYGPTHGVFYPTGVVIDPAAGRIYWTDGLIDGKIKRAPLAGGASTPDILYGATQGVNGGSALAIDPAAGRIFWANYRDSTIRSAPLAGGASTSDTPYDSAREVWNPTSVVLDPAGGPATIVPGPSLDTSSGFALGPGIAKAAARVRELIARVRAGGSWGPPPAPSGRIYWSNGGAAGSADANTIKGAPLSGGGTPDTLYTTATQGVTGASALAVHRAPVGTGAPTVGWSLIFEDQPFAGLGYGGSGSGPGGWPGPGGTVSGPSGQRLTCSRGAWAPDLIGCFCYRAPQSFAFQWRLNGTDIGGANTSTYDPTGPGSYSCRVTATNAAGSASQVSAAVAIS